jgi:uncharacterized damage-inducible protein DinB
MSFKPALSDIPAFYQPYIAQLPDAALMTVLQQIGDAFISDLHKISETQAAHRYQPGKWSVKQLLGHINDAERIFTYRALCISRGEQISLPGFDENSYVENASSDDRTWASLVEEFQNIRRSTLDLYRSLTDTQLNRTGVANSLHFTPQIIGFITAGHQYHHQMILHNRYQLPQ